jgi:hypothetical protein
VSKTPHPAEFSAQRSFKNRGNAWLISLVKASLFGSSNQLIVCRQCKISRRLRGKDALLNDYSAQSEGPYDAQT